MTADSSPIASTGKARRRWLQFSLRTMLVVMVPVACVAAWLGWELEKGRRQQAAIEWVEDVGGYVAYDDEATKSDWRRKWLGAWFPESVRAIGITAPPDEVDSWLYVCVRSPEVTDISLLANLENLEQLDLRRTGVVDLAPLARLEKLESLYLDHTEVTVLAPLAELRNLKHLSLVFTPVRDVAPLAELEKLETLSLNSTDITEEQVQRLREALPHCQIRYWRPSTRT